MSVPLQPQPSTAPAPAVMGGSDHAAVLASERVTAVKREGMLNKCQAAEILEESWFVNTTGLQRQYFVSWHSSIVTASRLKQVSDKFDVESCTADGVHHWRLLRTWTWSVRISWRSGKSFVPHTRSRRPCRLLPPLRSGSNSKAGVHAGDPGWTR